MILVEYEILGSSEIELLEEEVNRAIQDDWLPIGGVSFSESVLPESWDDNFHHTYLQAMGRYAPDGDRHTP